MSFFPNLGNARGFTLLELMVVMVLLALVATIAASAPPPGRLPGELTAAARQLAAALRQARSDALAQSREVTFAIDVATGRYSGGALPAGVELVVDAAAGELADATTGGIRFYPDGSFDRRAHHAAPRRRAETVTVALADRPGRAR